MRCVAYSTAEYYDFTGLMQFFEQNDCKIKMHNKEVLHVSKFKEGEDLFFFDYGCVVFWNYTQKVENQILDQISRYNIKPEEHVEFDEFKYHFGKEAVKTTIKNDMIHLAHNNILEKLSISFGLSQSIKLATFETILAQTIEETRHLPKSLVDKGKIKLSRKEIAQKMGRILMVRNSINLHTEILDTPNFFWDNPEYNNLYKLIVKDLEVPTRVDVLNRRLEMIQELYSMLSNELNHQHSSLLEWIIIILISVEIGLFIIKEIVHP